MSELTPDVDTLQQLRASIEQRLSAATTEAERASLKADIMSLYRQADSAARSFDALRNEARKFAELWKKSAGPSTLKMTVREDHLGASTYIEKGWTLLSAESYGEAGQALKRALELVPGQHEATTLLAWALAHEGRLEDAEAVLKPLTSCDADAPLPATVAGFLAYQRGDAQAAMGLLHRAIANGSHDRRAFLYAHLYLGIVFRSLDMHDAAIEYLQRALTLGPNLLQAAFELGHTLWLCERRDEAQLAWRAGAQANKFSVWGKRCAEMMIQVEEGSAPARSL